MRYTTVAELERRLAAHRELDARLREVVIELAAALIRADRNGYQAKVVESCLDRKSTRLNSSHVSESRMPSSA